MKKRQKKTRQPSTDFEQYFKIGVSRDYVLVRDDFPVADIPPGEFSRLIREVFRKNDEVLDAEE